MYLRPNVRIYRHGHAKDGVGLVLAYEKKRRNRKHQSLAKSSNEYFLTCNLLCSFASVKLRSLVLLHALMLTKRDIQIYIFIATHRLNIYIYPPP